MGKQAQEVYQQCFYDDARRGKQISIEHLVLVVGLTLFLWSADDLRGRKRKVVYTTKVEKLNNHISAKAEETTK